MPTHNQLNRAQFMQFFRDDETLSLLTPDDRLEIFSSILLGSDDITLELLERLLSDYCVANIVVHRAQR